MGFVEICQEMYNKENLQKKNREKTLLVKKLLQKAQKKNYSTQSSSDSDSEDEYNKTDSKELVEISKNQANCMVDYCLRKLQHNMYLMSIFVPGSSCLSSNNPLYYFYKKIQLKRKHYVLSLILPHDVPSDILEEIGTFLYYPLFL